MSDKNKSRVLNLYVNFMDSTITNKFILGLFIILEFSPLIHLYSENLNADISKYILSPFYIFSCLVYFNKFNQIFPEDIKLTTNNLINSTSLSTNFTIQTNASTNNLHFFNFTILEINSTNLFYSNIIVYIMIALVFLLYLYAILLMFVEKNKMNIQCVKITFVYISTFVINLFCRPFAIIILDVFINRSILLSNMTIINSITPVDSVICFICLLSLIFYVVFIHYYFRYIYIVYTNTEFPYDSISITLDYFHFLIKILICFTRNLAKLGLSHNNNSFIILSAKLIMVIYSFYALYDFKTLMNFWMHLFKLFFLTFISCFIIFDFGFYVFMFTPQISDYLLIFFAIILFIIFIFIHIHKIDQIYSFTDPECFTFECLKFCYLHVKACEEKRYNSEIIQTK